MGCGTSWGFSVRIWVDADACPTVIRDIIVRAAERTQVQTTFVANQYIKTPPSKFVTSVQVPAGFDVADNEIVRLAEPDDLVITSDIPLAAEVIEKGGLALNARGELYTVDTVKARLNMRDFMDTMRSSGIHTGGPAALSQADRREFSNQLDRLLTRYQNKKTHIQKNK
jgi:uncharacterized protein YaiI (UPF0178 family)